MEDIFLKNLDDFKLILHIIGYKNEGESIIFLLKEKEEILFSSIIDSYQKDELNISLELLDELYKIKNIDYIFWTHPHEDHSTGLEKIIKKFSDKETIFIVPQDLEYSKKNLNNLEKNILDKMIQSSGKYKFQKTLVNDGGENLIFERNFLYNEKRYTLTIKSLSPHSGVIEEIKNNKTKKVNDFSICLQIEIISNQGEKYSMLLTGDIENKTIRLMRENALKEVNFLKIPHHSSMSSDVLTKKIKSYNQNVKIACTTSYVKGNLPQEEVLEKYLENYQEIIILGKEKEDIEENYGILTLEGQLKDYKFIYYLDGLYEVYSKEK